MWNLKLCQKKYKDQTLNPAAKLVFLLHHLEEEAGENELQFLRKVCSHCACVFDNFFYLVKSILFSSLPFLVLCRCRSLKCKRNRVSVCTL